MENRSYGRTKVNNKALIYDSVHNKEITCDIDNISERGICFKVPKISPNCIYLHVGDTLSFQFVDSFMERSGDTEDVIVAHRAQIRHITENNDYLIIGCYLAEPEFEKYAIRRKISNYMERKDRDRQSSN